MSIDKMAVKLTVVEMFKGNLGNMALDKMSVDEMAIDEMS
jgi:hypothetical protein